MSQLKVDSIVPRGGLPSGASGGIIQMKSAILTSSVETSNTSTFQDTGMSVTITPQSSSNKILVYCTSVMMNTSSNCGGCFSVFRGSTNIASSGKMGSFHGEEGSNNPESGSAGMVIDSPSTTSAVTYTAKIRAFSGTIRFAQRGVAYMVCMEVAG